jgi:hypothetical protein
LHTITPDVSRTFHFGRKGANVNNDGYYILYYHPHVVNKVPNVRLRGLDRLQKVRRGSLRVGSPALDSADHSFPRAERV